MWDLQADVNENVSRILILVKMLVSSCPNARCHCDRATGVGTTECGTCYLMSMLTLLPNFSENAAS